MVLCDGWWWLVYEVISKGTWFKGTHKPLDESTLNELFIDYLSFSYWKTTNTKWSLAFFHLFLGAVGGGASEGWRSVITGKPRGESQLAPYPSMTGLACLSEMAAPETPPTHKPHVQWWDQSVRQFAIVTAKNDHHWVSREYAKSRIHIWWVE